MVISLGRRRAGRPRNYTYGAAKGGLSLFTQGMRSELAGSGVSLTTIRLGPVDSPMTATHKKNALFSTPERVAVAIVKAADNRKSAPFVPGYWAVIMGGFGTSPKKCSSCCAGSRGSERLLACFCLFLLSGRA